MTDYEKGVVYYYSKDYENARNFLELAKSGAKEISSDTLLMLGKTYEQLGDSNYAASLYEKYLAETMRIRSSITSLDYVNWRRKIMRRRLPQSTVVCPLRKIIP